MEKSIFSAFLRLVLWSIRRRIKSATFSGRLSVISCFPCIRLCVCVLLLKFFVVPPPT